MSPWVGAEESVEARLAKSAPSADLAHGEEAKSDLVDWLKEIESWMAMALEGETAKILAGKMGRLLLCTERPLGVAVGQTKTPAAELK